MVELNQVIGVSSLACFLIELRVRGEECSTGSAAVQTRMTTVRERLGALRRYRTSCLYYCRVFSVCAQSVCSAIHDRLFAVRSYSPCCLLRRRVGKQSPTVHEKDGPKGANSMPCLSTASSVTYPTPPSAPSSTAVRSIGARGDEACWRRGHMLSQHADCRHRRTSGTGPVHPSLSLSFLFSPLTRRRNRFRKLRGADRTIVEAAEAGVGMRRGLRASSGHRWPRVRRVRNADTVPAVDQRPNIDATSCKQAAEKRFSPLVA